MSSPAIKALELTLYYAKFSEDYKLQEIKTLNKPSRPDRLQEFNDSLALLL